MKKMNELYIPVVSNDAKSKVSWFRFIDYIKIINNIIRNQNEIMNYIKMKGL